MEGFVCSQLSIVVPQCCSYSLKLVNSCQHNQCITLVFLMHFTCIKVVIVLLWTLCGPCQVSFRWRLYDEFHWNPTPRIPYSYCCSCCVTKSVKWRYLGNQAWYHRSAGVKTTDLKKWPFSTLFLFDFFIQNSFWLFWHQRIYGTTLSSRDIVTWRFLWHSRSRNRGF